MTTYTQFLPTAAAPFQFGATFDGSPYTVVVTWNTFGQRWYINIVDQNGVLIVTRALVASPAGVPIEAAFWQQQTVYVTTEEPHGYVIGSTVNVTITGVQPDAYNGQVFALVTGPTTFTYPLTADPGAATVLGGTSSLESYNVSLTQGYFDSTLVFREGTEIFEVSP